MSAELDALKQEVADSIGVQESAAALINGLADKIDELIANGDTAGLTQLAADLRTEREKLTQAVQENPVP